MVHRAYQRARAYAPPLPSGFHDNAIYMSIWAACSTDKRPPPRISEFPTYQHFARHWTMKNVEMDVPHNTIHGKSPSVPGSPHPSATPQMPDHLAVISLP